MISFKFFPICMFKDPNLAENLTNLAEFFNKIELRRVHGGPAKYDHDHKFNGFFFTPYLTKTTAFYIGMQQHVDSNKTKERKQELY